MNSQADASLQRQARGEHTIDALRKHGIRQVFMATHYKAEAFSEHFGDGHAFGVQIDYIRGGKTARYGRRVAALPKGDDPLLVINGDIITDLSYGAMLRFHRESEAEMTVGVVSTNSAFRMESWNPGYQHTGDAGEANTLLLRQCGCLLDRTQCDTARPGRLHLRYAPTDRDSACGWARRSLDFLSANTG